MGIIRSRWEEHHKPTERVICNTEPNTTQALLPQSLQRLSNLELRQKFKCQELPPSRTTLRLALQLINTKMKRSLNPRFSQTKLLSKSTECVSIKPCNMTLELVLSLTLRTNPWARGKLLHLLLPVCIL